MSSIAEIGSTLIGSVRNDLTTVLRKSIDSDDKAILQVSPSTSSNLNGSIYLPR
jgi:hypothetical protein